RLCNVPLEAWTTNGISALASRLGNLLVMDNTTAEMCKMGVGRVGYARVLVEVSAHKCLPEEIEVVYRDKNKVEMCRKKVQVRYDWLPTRCPTCCVFGHSENSCRKNDLQKKPDSGHGNDETKNKDTTKMDEDGFTQVRSRKYNGNGDKNSNNQTQNFGLHGQRKNPVTQFMYQKKNKDETKMDKQCSKNDAGNDKSRKAWSVQGDFISALRKCANKFIVLNELDDHEEGVDPNTEKQSDVNDVFPDNNGIEKGMESDNIEGMDKGQNEVKKFIGDEKLSICTIIETRIKTKKLQSIGDSIFKNWDWVHNMRFCDKGCRIILGWDSDIIHLNVISYCKQSMLCKVDVVKGSLSMFCTFVYAANGGNERLELWKELVMYKRVIGNNAWAIMGDMNVTLDPKEHSAGKSYMSKDMYDFKECVNLIEVEDITSSGLFYTWTKNLYKTKNGDDAGILKKLDRAMGNETFICKFSQAHAIFLPYLISVILVLPNSVKAKKKSFRFANFFTNKEEFGDIVKNHWGSVNEGCNMFRVVQNLKLLKKYLKDLAWKDGDIFKNVKELRIKLKEVQTKIDKDPTDKVLREEESKILHEYNNAMSDEEKFLINAIHDEEGKRYEGNEVGEQFVNHFKKFLGESIPVRKILDIDELFKAKLSQDEALSMIHDVSDAEIKRAMFQIDDNKAPGPDGFSSHFYKKAWDTIGGDICKAVKDFFHKGKILSEINSTVIALVPKIQTPAKVSDYRPIACCNLLKGYERKGGPKRVALKIDLQKAYDTVNWCFLADILKVVNGESCGYIKGGRGLRQGDPISPYLFTLVMEVLNLLMIRNTVKNGSFNYHFGSLNRSTINEFWYCLGLLPILQQKVYYIGGIMRIGGEQSILIVVPFRVEKLLVKYLGVPLVTKRIGVKDCKNLVDKVRNRIMSWKNKCLTYAGRLQLVAFVLESIHVYWATVFPLPQLIVNEINSLLKGFLWNQEERANGRAKIAWKSLCKPKS
ncbi:RNA-directed DNA polymerase, eukaryota, reverse transcriptase zinc-binding domain protein, partial [Tanacetum coccineum]